METKRKTMGFYKETPLEEHDKSDDPTAESWRGNNLFFKDSAPFRNLSALVNSLDFDTDGDVLHIDNKPLGFLEVSARINEVFDVYRAGNHHPDLSTIPEQLRAAVQACLDDLGDTRERGNL